MDQAKDTGAAGVGVWISLILRLAIAALFLSAAVSKLKGGAESIQGTVAYFESAFAETWLPGLLVKSFGYITPFAEALIVLWLIVGFRLKAAWVFTCLMMISLAFGMAVAKNYDTAANNFNYVLICCAGLYFSRYDRYHVGRASDVSM
jgi:uncharacterized membrane protein YphA (DoxX/SURF4 family)